MNNLSEDLQLYFSRVKPICRELFGMANAICGGYEAAEYVLQRTVLDGWNAQTRAGAGSGFRADMRERLRLNALLEADKSDGSALEQTAVYFPEDALPEDPDEEPRYTQEEAIALQEIRQEGAEVQRLLLLHYGCGLKLSDASRLLELPVKQAQDVLERFEARVRRKMPVRQRRHYDTVLTRLSREELLRSSASMPDTGSIYRRFEAEAMEVQRRPNRWLSHAVNAILVVVLALLCAFLFWIVAVLMQAPQPDSAAGLQDARNDSRPAWSEAFGTPDRDKYSGLFF